MKIKNAVLFDIGFVEAVVHFSKIQLPVKVSYPLQKCLKVLQVEETSAKAHRDELVKKYGTVINNEDGTQKGWDITKSSKTIQEKFWTELNDLFNIEFDIPIENKFSISIKDIEDQKISTTHLNAIEVLVDFQE